jgi:hypothetical protein
MLWLATIQRSIMKREVEMLRLALLRIGLLWVR